MSLDPILWAMKDAPTANVEEWAVLCCMAESADEDGCNAFQATATIATRAKLSPRTVQRRIDALVERRLIVLGDQENPRLLRIPEHKRPVNYDVAIPYDWYGNIDRVNAYRETQGRPPLTPGDRPPPPPAPPKKKRADAGKPKSGSSEDATQADLDGKGEDPSKSGGDYKSPPDTESPQGVTTSHGEGRQEVTQPTPTTHPPTHPKDTSGTLREPTDADSNADPQGAMFTGDGFSGPGPEDAPVELTDAEVETGRDDKGQVLRGKRLDALAQKIAKAWWDWCKAEGHSHPASGYPACRAVIRTALGAGVNPKDLRRALATLTLQGHPVSGNTVQIALRDLKPGAGAGKGRSGYRDESWADRGEGPDEDDLRAIAELTAKKKPRPATGTDG